MQQIKITAMNLLNDIWVKTHYQEKLNQKLYCKEWKGFWVITPNNKFPQSVFIAKNEKTGQIEPYLAINKKLVKAEDDIKVISYALYTQAKHVNQYLINYVTQY